MKRILIHTHYPYYETRTGMTLLVRDLAKELSKEFDVSVVCHFGETSRTIDGIHYYTKNDQDYTKYSYEHTIAHPPFSKHGDIGLYDSVKQVDGEYDPKRYNYKLVIFTANHIKESYNYTKYSTVMHPPVFPELQRTIPGGRITLVGMTEHKGIRTAVRLSKMNPRLKFMGVRSGWNRRGQIPYRSLNFTTMQEVEDTREIWSKTKVVIAPSLEEQYGKASLESMASGIPVIAYDCPGVREALGKGALILNTLDIDAWNEALHHVLDNYEKYSQRALRQSKKVNSAKELTNVLKRISEL